jgi:hypothetical protein
MSSSGQLSDLITTPMRATSAEADDLAFTLPAQFINEFFYTPSAADMETHTGIFLDTWLTGQVTLDFQFERPDRQEARRQAAWNGLILAALTLAPATLELFFGIIFATIAAAVLVIIILFLACIPLGFFSFGKDILTAIIKQYFVLWGLTLASGIAIGALLGAGQIFLPPSPTISAVVLYLPVLVVIGIAVSFLLSLSYRVMLGTFGMLTATLRTTLTRDVQNGRLPQGGDVPLTGTIKRALGAAQNVAGLAALGTTAALTGGGSAVLPALAGGVLSRSDSRTGRDAALLARMTSNSPAARTFSAAAMTPYTLPSALAVYAVNRGQQQQVGPQSARVANVFTPSPTRSQPTTSMTQPTGSPSSVTPNVVFRQSATSNAGATVSPEPAQSASAASTTGISQQQFASFFDDTFPSYNVLALGQSGSGKTFGIQLMALRHMLTGCRIIMVDPQGNIDWSFLGDDVCQMIRLGTQHSRLNVLDITHDELPVQIESVLSILKLLEVYGDHAADALARSVLDQLLTAMYSQCWQQPDIAPPTLTDLQQALDGVAEQEATTDIGVTARNMSYRLARYVRGSQADLFGGHSTVDFSLGHPVTIFDISALPNPETEGNLRAALLSILVGGTSQAIKRLRKQDHPASRAPIIWFIDEMGVLMRDPVIASNTSYEFKTARARLVSMIVADQDLHSLLGRADPAGTHHGEPMLANAAVNMIFFQREGQRDMLNRYYPEVPIPLRERVYQQGLGQCVLQLPNDVLQMTIRPSDFERVVLSSRLQDRERRHEMIAKLRRQLQGA